MGLIFLNLPLKLPNRNPEIVLVSALKPKKIEPVIKSSKIPSKNPHKRPFNLPWIKEMYKIYKIRKSGRMLLIVIKSKINNSKNKIIKPKIIIFKKLYIHSLFFNNKNIL